MTPTTKALIDQAAAEASRMLKNCGDDLDYVNAFSVGYLACALGRILDAKDDAELRRQVEFARMGLSVSLENPS